MSENYTKIHAQHPNLLNTYEIKFQIVVLIGALQNRQL
jgi:hypothetical protein